MTRDECWDAVAQALGVQRVEASSSFWHVTAQSTPVREVFFTPAFVADNIVGDGMTVEALRDYIKNRPENCWAQIKDGALFLTLR